MITPNSGKLRLSSLRSTLEISDVFIANLDHTLTNLTLLLGGIDALRGAKRVHVLTACILDTDVRTTFRIDSRIGITVIGPCDIEDGDIRTSDEFTRLSNFEQHDLGHTFRNERAPNERRRLDTASVSCLDT